MKSPYLVQVQDFGQTPSGRTFFVMEYLVGRTLGAALKARGVIPVAEAIGYCVQVLAGLEVAHAKGTIHRDVKLDNVFPCDATNDSSSGESAPGVDPGRVLGGKIVGPGSDDQTGWGDLNDPRAFSG
jgi:serine/threonine-protein kinase